MPRRESGRDSRTSSVPRCRSPATAAAANPTANTRLSPTAIGWTKPSATAPVRLKMSPPPNWANWGGMAPLSNSSWNCEPNESKMIGRIVPHSSSARGDDQEPQAIRPPGVGEQGAVHADVPAAAPAGASTGS